MEWVTVIVRHDVKRVKYGAIHDGSRNAVMRKVAAEMGMPVIDVLNGWSKIRWDFPTIGQQTVSVVKPAVHTFEEN